MADSLIHSRLLNDQMLHLPHTREGQIDYRTLGNMISATLMGEVIEASYVDHEYGRETTYISSLESEWQFYYKENDVVVLRKKVPNTKLCCFMGRGVVDVPIDQVVAYIHKFNNRLEWDNYAVQVEVCQQYSEHDWLLYMAHEATQCLFKSHRDFLYYCRTGYVEGKYVQSSMSVEDKDYPHRPPYIRAEIKPGSGWVVEKYKDTECSTLISYLAHLDLKDVPAIILNRGLRRQPMAIAHIRKKLTARKVPLNISYSPSNSLRLQHASSYVPQSNYYEEATPMTDYMGKNFNELNKSTDVSSTHELYPWIAERKHKNRVKSLSVSTTTSSVESSHSTRRYTDIPKTTDDIDEEMCTKKQIGNVGCDIDKSLHENATVFVSSEQRPLDQPLEDIYPQTQSHVSESQTQSQVSEQIRSRLYTNSLPDLHTLQTSPDHQVQSGASNGTSHVTPNDVADSTVHVTQNSGIVSTDPLKSSQDEKDDPKQKPIIVKPESSLKAQRENNVAQNFPSFSSWTSK